MPRALTDADKRILATLRPAGILLLKRNFDHSLPYPAWLHQLTSLLAQVREYTEREHLLVSIDHEGQRVHRLPPPITVFPNAIRFGTHAADVARAQALELRSLGINVSWAPVTDIHSNPQNPIIGERSFGHTPDEVIATALPYFSELQRQGILGCAKHFPGHGDTSTDSHLELPTLDLRIEQLAARELLPFQKMIDAGVSLIMTAHILFPQLDPRTPATMSRFFITELLRGQMGYKKVVVTDDLDMKAVSKDFEGGNMIAQALNVGCDMFIVARQPGADDQRCVVLAQSIASALEQHITTEDTLFQAFCRINEMFEQELPNNQPQELSAEVFQQHAALARALES
ncbi:MAG: glycoside hydrolase family 3 protein [Proteobacteria bacterium]|nr:glycoside hydrolase family 3 protein [Pseudomonadota bacterium]